MKNRDRKIACAFWRHHACQGVWPPQPLLERKTSSQIWYVFLAACLAAKDLAQPKRQVWFWVILICRRWQLGQATDDAQMRLVKALSLTWNIQNMLFLCKEALGLQSLLVCSSNVSSVLLSIKSSRSGDVIWEVTVMPTLLPKWLVLDLSDATRWTLEIQFWPFLLKRRSILRLCLFLWLLKSLNSKTYIVIFLKLIFNSL